MCVCVIHLKMKIKEKGNFIRKIVNVCDAITFHEVKFMVFNDRGGSRYCCLLMHK